MKLQAQFTLSLFIGTLIVLCLSLFHSFRYVETTAKDNAYKTCNMILAQVESKRQTNHTQPSVQTPYAPG